ncbi:T9SS type A sorting domain-containing protein [Geojedonia litorea]|uniref:T9SS type A sorting domain-containing protein n=1 Tax=Geojedonia litorea TaxID=1268269 RepID=A0ABV9N227_9FLAO
MKKITLLTFLISFYSNYAQNTCATAINVSTGDTTVGTIDGTDYVNGCYWDAGDHATLSEWYSFTATVNGVVTITSDLAQNGNVDTRLNLFSGSCGSLICIAASDDIGISSNSFSEITFGVILGQTYYFQWDNAWETTGFDFNLTETAVNCNNSLPYSEDLTNPNFFYACFENIDNYDKPNLNDYAFKWSVKDYGDGNNMFRSPSFDADFGDLETDNWLISGAINLTSYSTSDIINLTWIARGKETLAPAENYTVYAATSNVIANLEASPVTFNETFVEGGEGDGAFTPTRTLDLSSLAGNMIYFAFRHHNVPGGQAELNIDNIAITATLGIDDQIAKSFKHYYNKNSESLILKSPHSVFSNVQLFDILGKKVLSRDFTSSEAHINLSQLDKGVYIAKIRLAGEIKTIRFIKQ